MVKAPTKIQMDLFEGFNSREEHDQLMSKLLAGSAKFTLVSKRTGQRFTYWLRSNADDKNRNWTVNNQDRTRYWVRLLNGPDNSRDFVYLGFMNGSPTSKAYAYARGSKSPVSGGADSARAIAWFLHKVFLVGVVPDDVEVLFSSCCLRCGRELTVPESIKSGFGPECIAHA